MFRSDAESSERCGHRPLKIVLYKCCLNVKQEVDNVAVFHDVLLALTADQSLCLGCGHGAAGFHILKGNDLGPDEAPLEVRVDFAGGLGALVPFLMVHARHSSLPAVRKEIRPSRV